MNLSEEMKTNLENPQNAHLSLYLHIPFCEVKCFYCDFNTYANIESLIPGYVNALTKEICFWNENLRDYEVKTIFFGGGTPSYLKEADLSHLMNSIDNNFNVIPEIEVTIEANPGDVDLSKLSTYLECGINRLSIGVQSFDDHMLKLLGRKHTSVDIIKSYQLAMDAGCNAYAAPIGFMEAAVDRFLDRVPLILKLNNHDVLNDEADPLSSVTSSVDDALRLGCVAVGFTIYPGSTMAQTMYQQLREIALEAKAKGLAVVVWSYPRGSGLNKAGETAIDVVSYAAQIAAQLGAHVIKVKLPSEHIELPEARKVYEKQNIPIGTQAERVRHLVQSAFNNKRIVIFSGGAAKGDEEFFQEVRAIRDGGGFGSIIGRNAFQRAKPHAHEFLNTVMQIYDGSLH